MDFQAQHGLSADGVAGPMTIAALIKDALAHRADQHTYNFVHVSKGSPESLTVYVNGAVKFHVPVSTGITGATTYDGTFAVYEHVYYTEMKGTDVDGTKYDDNIYWASYFNGGEAMHAYPRASYGFPQSNGCVEMNPATAKSVWPFTPLGTPVTVLGTPVTVTG
jgi:lipoprotein-anchoring transpeptidase ErfK/SrfK